MNLLEKRPSLSLLDLESVLLSTLDEKSFFTELAKYLYTTFEVHRVYIYSLHEDEAILMADILNGSPAISSKERCSNKNGVIGHVVRTKASYYSNAFQRDPLFIEEKTQLPKVYAELCVPILGQHSTLATVHLQLWDRGEESKKLFNESMRKTTEEALRLLERPLQNILMYFKAKYLNELLLKRIEEKEEELKNKLRIEEGSSISHHVDASFLVKAEKVGPIGEEKIYQEEVNLDEKGQSEQNIESKQHEAQKKEEEAFVLMSLASLEKRHIALTLEHMKGNKTRAAQVLGITVKTLYNKLYSYGLLGASV